MRFRAVRFVDARYTVSPTYWKYHTTETGGAKEKIPGIHVLFTNGMTDTVEMQRRFKWSDEVREMVENWLLNHEEYGIKFVRDAGETETIKPASTAQWCDFILITENGSQMCGVSVTEGSRCGAHQPEMATT